MISIIDKAKEYFLDKIKDNPDPYHLVSHLNEAEKWAEFMIKKYPSSDPEIVRLSIWLHDIGHYPISDIDHAIIGEQIAKEFLTRNDYDSQKIKDVLHCIRSHRCKDIMPVSFEAKIVAFVDSASHMTDSLYIEYAKTQKENNSKVIEKINRDFRDLSLFPELKVELTGLYNSWISLIKSLEKIKPDF